MEEHIVAYDASLCSLTAKTTRWILDSGASGHFTNNDKMLVGAVPYSGFLTVGGGERHKIEKAGSLVIKDEIDGRVYILVGVLYCPAITLNIISPRRVSAGDIGVIEKSGTPARYKPTNTFSCVFSLDEGWIIDSSNEESARLLVSKYEGSIGGYSPAVKPLRVIVGPDNPSIGKIKQSQRRLNTAVDSRRRLEELIVQWHKRLGHCGLSQLEIYAKENGSLPTALTKISNTVQQMPPCRTCIVAKKNRGTFGRSDKIADAPLDLVHIDISGPSRIDSAGGHKYFLVFLDDYSRMVWVYFLKTREKEELKTAVLAFLAIRSPSTGTTVKEFHSDNEFNHAWFTDFCTERSIKYLFIHPHTPQMNSRAERMMRTLKEPARAMLGSSGLPLSFWNYAVSTAAYLRCRLTHSVLEISPYERFYGRKPRLNYLRTFGCVCYMHYPKEARQQNGENGAYDPRAQLGIFLGYATKTPGYVVYLPVQAQFKSSSHVVFNEAATWIWDKNEKYLEERKSWQAYDLWPEDDLESAERREGDLSEDRRLEIAEKGLLDLPEEELIERAEKSADALQDEIVAAEKDASDRRRADEEKASAEAAAKEAREKEEERKKIEVIVREEQDMARQRNEFDSGRMESWDDLSDSDEDEESLPTSPVDQHDSARSEVERTPPSTPTIDCDEQPPPQEPQLAEGEAESQADDTPVTPGEADVAQQEKAEAEERAQRAEKERAEAREQERQREAEEIERKRLVRESRRAAVREERETREKEKQGREKQWRSVNAPTSTSSFDPAAWCHDTEIKLRAVKQNAPSMHWVSQAEAELRQARSEIAAFDHCSGEIYFDSELDDGTEDFMTAFAAHFSQHKQPASRATLHGTPVSMYEVRKMAKWPEYRKAMEEEWASLWTMSTFEYCDLPPGKNLLGSKWVITEKVDIHGKVIRYKARLVAQGFGQVYGIDYVETFSPVIQLPALRAMIAAAIVRGYRIKLLDVKTAYLYGTNEHEIYMTIPVDFKADGDNRVLRVIKSLYGLKASGREWFKTLSSRLEQHGFTQSPYQDCVFVNRKTGAVLLTYVDDLVLLCPNEQIESEATNMLKSEFTMTESPPNAAFLGIAMEPLGSGRRGYALNQRHYIATILKRFGLENHSGIKRPMAKNDRPVPAAPNYVAEPSAKTEYQCKIGSLMWVSQVTRPDIAHNVHLMARFASNPTIRHHEMVDDIFRYLKHTSDYSIVFEPDQPDNLNAPLTLEAYSDADWAGDTVAAKSTTGILVKLNGMVIDWKSQLQTTVALSSTDSEVIALSETSRRVIGLKNAISDAFEGVDQGPIVIRTDSNTALAVTKEFANHDRLKHLNVRYQYIRHCLKDKAVVLQRVPTAFNLADPLTKSVEPALLERFKGMVQIMRSSRAKKGEV